MDSNRARSSRWRSASSPRRDDDEDVDPHTVISAPPPAAAAAAAASRPSTAPTTSPAPAGNTNNNNLQPPPPRYSFARSDAGRPTYERTRQPSIRIRRSSSGSQAPPIDYASESSDTDGGTRFGIRPRSISQPSPAAQSNDGNVARHSRRVPQLALPRLTEEGSRPTMAELGVPMSPARSLPDHRLDDDEQRRRLSAGSEPGRRLTRKRKLSKLLWPGSLNRGSPAPPSDTEAGGNAAQGHAQGRPQPQSDEYGEGLVDWLDIIDPEVQTLSTLTNVQNSLFVPDLGPWINRRPTYVLSQRETGPLSRLARPAEREEERLPEIPDEASAVQTGVEPTTEAEAEGPTTLRRSDTITSRLTDSHYAALPHGFSLEGWTEEEKMELDDRVRHMLHSRRSRFKRTMKGFGQYVRRPLGFFVTLYATLITLFGLAWVLFLIGWIYVGDKQVYTIHIIDSVLVALFAIMGDGLAPFRAVDTYHMAFVVHYSRKIAKAKKQKQKLKDKEAASAGVSFERLASSSSNLPTGTPAPMPVPVPAPAPELEQAMVDHNADVEAAKLDIEYDQDSPLTFKQWKRMRHHQKKLAKSHSFYKPDETFTHHAFPLSYLIAIVILLDCHSCLQISLGATTWGIDYHHRPFAITTVILCVSITCNITAGLVITIGDRKTRKKDVWKLLTRQELTGDAIKHLETKRAKEQSRSHGSSQNSIQDEVQTDAVIIKEDN
ncbi:hypothetical protein BBK36DRAFT_1171991 [Trichoderma citrinoviride]|uniref:Integral membrane protein n=1 Tax=Trichoderma citrinoviride TaxID=58853 RepID=A0A2T4B1W0_9HYPO|nr:hypothetical protein BBK36DRAFT_1171991 [Trichoderma citrinoviride]PTB63191.1 hypothetical protein BBK36DRAFT_1171991 [Trichoderma citrinoviride]